MTILDFLGQPTTASIASIGTAVATGVRDVLGRGRRGEGRSYEMLLLACKRRLESAQGPIELGRIARDLLLIRDQWPPLRSEALELLLCDKFLGGEDPRILAAFARDHDAAIVLAKLARKRAKAQRTLDFAAAVAGHRRVHLREEWAAVLAGDPDNGLALTSRQRLSLVVGFLLAAFRFRLRDAVKPLWVPVDWVLSVQSRTETSIALIVGVQAIYIAWSDGVHTLLTYGWGWCGACGGALYLLSKWLRRVRGIELAAVRSSGDD
jgi:hypothetical protein